MSPSDRRRAHPTRRRWRWVALAAAASLVLPGAGQLATGSHRRWSVAAAAAAGVGSTVFAAIAAARLAADPLQTAAYGESRATMIALVWLSLAVAAVRAWAAADAAWAARPELAWWFAHERLGLAVLCAAGAAGAAAPGVAAGWHLAAAERATAAVFSTHEAYVATPSAEPAADEPDGGAATAASTVPPDPWAEFERINVLLLGGDAGPGRAGLRTDAMILVSVDPRSGDTAMVSVPRNLQRLRFPEGSALAARFPSGFDGIANALYSYVAARPELSPAPDAENPAAQALKSAVAELLGVDVHYYVLVDMAGFVDVVDTFGTITVTVPERVPTPGNPPGAKHDVPAYIEAGVHQMDGTVALAYARSRSADSDYQRMGRQRCVLAGLADAADPLTLARVFPQLADAVGASVSTDIPRSRLGELAQVAEAVRAAGAFDAARTVTLTPPLVNPARWDPAEVRAIAAAVIGPAAPAPAEAAQEPAAATADQPGEPIEAACRLP